MSVQPQSSSANINAPSSQNLDDVALAAWLNQRNTDGNAIGYLHAKYLCKVFDLGSPGAPLLLADPGKTSKAVLKKLAKRQLLQQLALPLDTLHDSNTADPAWSLTPATQDEITYLLNARLVTLGRDVGRGAAISTKTAWQVWTDAGGRCMFTGCAKDLSTIPLYNVPARVGYLAHIIASDPDGPRGSHADSHRRADDPENIMLMCDGHHRLIDSFVPDKYDAVNLYAMRQAHRDLVRSFMNSLAFPRAKAITLLANLANVPTNVQESDLIGALLATRRVMLPGVAYHIHRTQRDDRRTPEFWLQYLHEHDNHIRLLVGSFNASSTAFNDELAIFPLHHTATLVLAGRIIGEARPIQVFQYHRQRGTWQWDPAAIPQPTGTFSVSGLIPNRVDEVLITIELSSSFDEESLPVNLAGLITSGLMPWVRITMQNPNSDCVQHPDDLILFTTIARGVINHVQDVMRARSVHLIALCPASAVFRVGQMLQAGHHPTYTIYDRANRDTPFGEAFSISGHEVSARAGVHNHTISIR